jgi:hypothetical protein
VYAICFARNYARKETQIADLFDFRALWLIEFEEGRSLPRTMGKDTSVWLVDNQALRDTALLIASMTTYTDSRSEQEAEVEHVVGSVAEPIEFTI